jgi:hypothetical protein
MSYDVVSLLPGFCAAFLGQADFAYGKIAFHDQLNVAALDYSMDSLHVVDNYLNVIRPDKDAIAEQDYTNTVLAAGCYIGEVIRRNSARSWQWVNYDEFIKRQPDMQPLVPDDLLSAAVLMTEDSRSSTFPFNKVLRNLEEGPENEIHFYGVGFALYPK